jgi:protein PsiE
MDFTIWRCSRSARPTVWSAFATFIGMVSKGHAELSDILLLSIYLEIGAIIGIYFKTTRLPVRYLIYIAKPRWAGS